MAKNLGMTPATVAEQARSMRSHMAVFDSIIADNRAPALGVSPGGTRPRLDLRAAA